MKEEPKAECVAPVLRVPWACVPCCLVWLRGMTQQSGPPLTLPYSQAGG